MITREHKLSIIALKYAPVVSSIVMMLHTVLLINNIEVKIADWIFSLPIFPCAVCILWSKAFGFCRLHRCFIFYVCLVSYCIKYQAIFGFGTLLTWARVIILIIGIVLIIILIIHKNEYNYIIKKVTNSNNRRHKHREL